MCLQFAYEKIVLIMKFSQEIQNSRTSVLFRVYYYLCNQSVKNDVQSKRSERQKMIEIAKNNKSSKTQLI